MKSFSVMSGYVKMIIMNIFQAVVLGIVQGVTEVLPISSSGHLVLLPWLFKFPDPGLAFDVALHMGTLIAIIIFFKNDWAKIIKGFFSGISKMKFQTSEEKLSLLIVLATIPGAFFGFILNKLAEDTLRNPLLIAGTTVIFAFALIFAEKKVGKKKIEEESSKSAIITGLAQAIAIIPGVSRSGITISAGMFQGFTREAAAKFSFLVSAPIIFGAGLIEIRKIPVAEYSTAVFWAGVLSAIVASFLTIRFLMNFVKSHKLNVFAYYRFGLAAVILVAYFLTK